MKIDFERVEVFTGIAKKQCVVENIREQFADLIYNTGIGVAAHALALKIYNSDSETEYTEEECNMILKFSERCSPNVIDAIGKLLEQAEK
jgi:hypothetical protein